MAHEAAGATSPRFIGNNNGGAANNSSNTMNDDCEDAGSGGQGREKRRRITQSCNMCRKKRIKCDGKEPRCGPCTSKELDCTWAETKKRGPVPGRNVQARMQRLEAHLSDLFHLVPGLEDISMMALGLSPYKPSLVSVNTNLPDTFEGVKALQAKTNRHAAFREGPIGRYFSDEQGDNGEASNTGDLPPYQQHQPSSSSRGGGGNHGFDFAGNHHNSNAAGSGEQGGFSAEPMSVADIIKMLSTGQQSALDLYTAPATTAGAVPPLPTSGVSDSFPTPASTSTSTTTTFVTQTTPNSLFPAASPRAEMKPLQQGRNDNFVWEEDRSSGICRVYGRSSNFKQAIPGPSSSALNPTLPKPPTPEFPPQMQRTRLMDTYLTIIHPLLPMCSRAHLMQWSCSPQPSADANLQPELLFAVLATASFYSSPVFPGGGTAHLYQASEMAKAARWCLKSSLASPTLTTVQTLTLLALYDICMGEFTKAWADLGLVMGLAVDLGLPQSHLVINSDDPSSIAHRTAWYCILIVETSLASLLGKPPLLSENVCPPIPSESGPDEWELWRSESVQSLEFSYGGAASSGTDSNGSLNTSPVQSFGIITPARTLSTFAQSAILAKLGRQILAVINNNHNNGASSNSDVENQTLRTSLHKLEDFKQNLSDIEISENSLSSVPQHRLDLYATWLHWKVMVLKHLIKHDPSFQASLDALAWQASGLLSIKSRLYTHYRTCALSLLLPLSAMSTWPTSEQVRQTAHASLQQYRRIFPDLVDKIRLATGDPTMSTVIRAPVPTYDTSFTSPTFSIPSVQSMPVMPEWPASLGGFDFGNGNGSNQNSNQQQQQQQQQQESSTSHHLSHLLNASNMVTQQAGTPSAGTGLHAQDATYSLPFAAMQNLSEQVGLQQSSQPFETSKIFDSASWAQTDVLSSLGFTDTPRGSPDHIGSEFSGLTGLLDRWNYSDGFTQS